MVLDDRSVDLGGEAGGATVFHRAGHPSKSIGANMTEKTTLNEGRGASTAPMTLWGRALVRLTMGHPNRNYCCCMNAMRAGLRHDTCRQSFHLSEEAREARERVCTDN